MACARFVLLCAILFTAACAAELAEPPPEVGIEEDGERPVGMYIVTDEPDRGSSTEAVLAASARRVIFLNGGGGTYRPGWNDSSTNSSSIVRYTATIPRYEGSASDWSRLLSCVQDLFARYNVEVTDVDPGSVPHVEAVMGGHPSHAGMGSGVGGVAPMNGDCSVVERAVVYIFTQNLGGVQTECEVAGQEIAHAYGLDHELECSDPMTYLSPCGAKTFQDSDEACGEYSRRACMCGGSTQNSHRVLLSRLGAAGTTPPPTDPADPDPSDPLDPSDPPTPGDTTPPVVAVLDPSDGAVLPASSTVEVTATVSDDAGLARVELLWQFGSTIPMDCARAPTGVSCTTSGDTHTWRFRVGTGRRAFSVRATDRAGNVTESPVVEVTFGDAPTPPPTDPPPSGAPAVTFDAPAESDSIRPGQMVSVRATATDDSWVTQVWLEWIAPTGSIQRRLYPIAGDQWGIDLSFSSHATPGTTRTLRLTAYDDTGNRATSGDRVLHVTR